MSLFKKREKPKTRIVKHDQPPTSPLCEAVTGGVNTQRNWEIRRDEFRTFESPQGRF